MKTRILSLGIGMLVFTGCTDFTSILPYEPPMDLQDGLEVGNLEEVKIDSQLILEAAGRIQKGKYGEVHSLLIYKDDRLVYEQYFQGHDYQWDAPKHYGDLVNWDSNSLHHTHSVSKSVTALCVGLAIDHGFIQNTDLSIFEYLPAYEYLKTPENEHITIQHLLTGTSGLLWAEWSAPLSSMENDQIAIYFHEKGPADFVLGRPMIAVPGTRFIYSGGNIELLAMIVENASGMSFQEFSAHYLFEPLGLDRAEWYLVYPSGETHAAGGWKATSREMLKIGVTMLHRGTWNGEELITEEWVDHSMHPFPASTGINVPGEDLSLMGYSYAWWTKEIHYRGKDIHWYSADGWGGQKIIVLPELNSVVVFTGANYNKKVRQYAIFEEFLLPALAD
jgi:CubicO group peptidase (beta-lactamase class C family)